MNIFNFEYETQTLRNKDNSESKYSVVYGQNGNIIHTKKDSYHIIPTQKISELAEVFRENENLNVKHYTHKDGEIIGLEFDFNQVQKTAVGDIDYNLILHIPNNGLGAGKLIVKETRLICTNGMVRNRKKDTAIRIPHNMSHEQALNIAKKSIIEFNTMVIEANIQDSKMNDIILDNTELRYKLNEWFFENEFPPSQKKDMTFNQFREYIVTNRDAIKCIDRLDELYNCMETELGYNKELNLDRSLYTVYATVTNYLSRRREKSNSEAPTQIQLQRQQKKVSSILQEVE